MGFIWEYLGHWSVLIMATGLIILIGGIVMLLVPIIKAVNGLLSANR
jgi:hypothetical protein